ncbi:unnamed protein product [Rhizoctonia solani]|uniref:Uncharacterized protein n=1 Tax=Rhizoctonia solani TaxID=456999 RepID=A0A8H3I5A4_9AGAM|nr:unnamed protein product [Rhizoctonia solani]CAE7220215.1 unnamed protein product [Rhizoctonia solani]
MTQVNSKNVVIDQFTYTPPPLPEYIARVHTLNTIVGVPSEGEVKEIHNAIRALNGLLSSIPSLYDFKLATQLAQHLFTVQMAIYRNEYPSSIFQSENVYTPPSFPSHLPISLEPVTGAPSDEELESAHKAVLTMENLANNPLFEFDALNVEASQYLFNLQFARYIQDSNHGRFAQKPPNTPARTEQSDPSIVAPDQAYGVEGQQSSQDPDTSSLGTESQASPLGHTLEPTPIPVLDHKVGGPAVSQQLEETNRFLVFAQKLLRIIGQTLLSSHYNANRNTGSYSSYRTTNDEGELPWMRNLPFIDGDSNCSSFRPRLTDPELVGYLKFYSIGSGLIEEETGDLIHTKKAEAEKRLATFLFWGRPAFPHAM